MVDEIIKYFLITFLTILMLMFVRIKHNESGWHLIIYDFVLSVSVDKYQPDRDRRGKNGKRIEKWGFNHPMGGGMRCMFIYGKYRLIMLTAAIWKG